MIWLIEWWHVQCWNDFTTCHNLPLVRKFNRKQCLGVGKKIILIILNLLKSTYLRKPKWFFDPLSHWRIVIFLSHVTLGYFLFENPIWKTWNSSNNITSLIKRLLQLGNIRKSRLGLLLSKFWYFHNKRFKCSCFHDLNKFSDCAWFLIRLRGLLTFGCGGWDFELRLKKSNIKLGLNSPSKCDCV